MSKPDLMSRLNERLGGGWPNGMCDLCERPSIGIVEVGGLLVPACRRCRTILAEAVRRCVDGEPAPLFDGQRTTEE